MKLVNSMIPGLRCDCWSVSRGRTFPTAQGVMQNRYNSLLEITHLSRSGTRCDPSNPWILITETFQKSMFLTET